MPEHHTYWHREVLPAGWGTRGQWTWISSRSVSSILPTSVHSHYPYPLLFPPLELDKLTVADSRDIACVKLDVIGSRGSRRDFARDLRRIESLLEESPVPGREWPRVLAVFDRDRLAPLLGISPSSAVRYARGARRTPDAVAARLHFIAPVSGDLAGAYNTIGIRRWFERPRAALDGRAPADLLAGDWAPDTAARAWPAGCGRSSQREPVSVQVNVGQVRCTRARGSV